MLKIGNTFEVRNAPALKPCPFCGEAAYIIGVFIPKHDDEMNAYEIGCEECGIAFTQAWEYDCILEKWNTRPEPPWEG